MVSSWSRLNSVACSVHWYLFDSSCQSYAQRNVVCAASSNGGDCGDGNNRHKCACLTYDIITVITDFIVSAVLDSSRCCFFLFAVSVFGSIRAFFLLAFRLVGARARSLLFGTFMFSPSCCSFVFVRWLVRYLKYARSVGNDSYTA